MTGSSDQSLEELRILLLRYLEGSLPIQIKQTVEDMLMTDEQAQRELEGLKMIQNYLMTDQTLFCPDPSEIADFVITGNDPSGAITSHLEECRSCWEELQSLRSLQPSDPIPPRVLETVRRKLAEVQPDKRYLELPVAAKIQPPDDFTLIRSEQRLPRPAPAFGMPEEPPPMPAADRDKRSFSLFWRVLLAISTAAGLALLWHYFIRGAP